MGQESETVDKTDQDVQEAIRSGEVEREKGEDSQDVLDAEVPGSEDLDPEDLGVEEEDDRNVMAVDTAFVVFIQDGAAYGVASLGEVAVRLGEDDVFLEPLRQATPDDLWRGCAEVCKDIEVSATASTTMAQFVEYTRQMQQQMQAQKVAQQVMGQKGGKSPGGGLQVPGR